jgi:hypothetical protein
MLMTELNWDFSICRQEVIAPVMLTENIDLDVELVFIEPWNCTRRKKYVNRINITTNCKSMFVIEGLKKFHILKH